MRFAARLRQRRRPALQVLAACVCICLPACKQPPPAPDPLAGVWRLNLARTRYSPSADPRRDEVMECTAFRSGVRCTITSVRSNGQRLVGRFAARYDGGSAPVSGMPGMDGVTLRRAGDRAVDATFTDHGTPVYGYRATRSPGGETLTVVSVDPATRAPLRSVVVYDRVSP